MTQPNLLKLAKQGNAKALAAMLNQSLQPKSITAKVNRKDDYLHILLESAQIPDQKGAVSFIRNGLIKLEVESIKTVKVYGRQIGEESAAWSQQFEILSPLETPLSTGPTDVVSPLETPLSTEPTDVEEFSSYQILHQTPRAVPPKVETPSSTRESDFQNPRRSSAMSKNPSSRPATGPLSVGNVVSASLRIYRDHFKLYLGLAFKAFLWAFVPIYGWAKSYQIQALISRQVFKELVNEPESVSTTRTQLNNHFWDFWIAQLLIGLIGFGVNVGLSIASLIISVIAAAILGSIAQDNPGISFLLGLLQLVVQLATLAIYLWVYSRFFIAELPLAIETDMSSTNCISRSWELTKGFVGRIEGVILVAGLITMPFLLLALIPVFVIIPVFATSTSPETIISAILLLVGLVMIFIAFSSTLMMPFWQAVKAVIYYDLRSRREGLGLQLRDSH